MSSVVFPRLFKRIPNSKAIPGRHLINLRESKQYRQENKGVVVQGLKTIMELRDQGIEVKSVIATAEVEPKDRDAIKFPASTIIDDPESLPAAKYFLTDVELTRRILGTHSRPGRHEIFAELGIKNHEFNPGNRVVVFDKITDPGNLGNLIRTSKGLGWDTGLVTSNSCDLFNDKSVRASRALVLTFPHKSIQLTSLESELKQHNITPIVADMLPTNDSSKKVWSPDYGESEVSDVKPGSGLWFWNFKDKQEIPEKIALVLSCEHHGVDLKLKDQIRVSVPLDPSVESLNVASAGSIIMAELNRLLRKRVSA